MNTVETLRATIETWSGAWSEPDGQWRLAMLVEAAAATCTCMDPNTQLVGHAAISEYMAGFQETAPGARFTTNVFRAHHDRCCMQWDMVDREGKLLSPGMSAGTFDAHGKLLQMVGFFDGWRSSPMHARV